MNLFKSVRGFTVIEHENYPNEQKISRLLQESSAVGDYKDAFEKPGSSFLWVSKYFHLNREQVSDLCGYLQRWLKTGKLTDEKSNKNNNLKGQ